MNYPRLDDAADHRTNERNRKGIIHMELERSIGVVTTMMWQDIEECPHEIQVLTCDVGDLEDGADALGDELGLWRVLMSKGGIEM